LSHDGVQTRRPTYLILNRFDDEFGEYHRFVGPDEARLAYITTPSGTRPLDVAGALDVAVVADTRLETVLPVARAMAARVGGFDGVVGLSEWDVLTAAQLREALGVRGGHAVRFVQRFRDKPLMKRYVARAGLRHPRFREVIHASEAGAIAAEIGLPLIVKPRAGAASAGVVRVDTLAELAGALDSPDDLQCEEFVAGDVCHVDGIRRAGGFHVVTASQYVNTCLGFAHGSPLGSVLLDPGPVRDAVLAFADACLSALGLREGPFHLEVIRRADGELYFLEVGLRPGGAEVPFLHRDLFGVDLYAEAFRVTVGLPAFGPARGVLEQTGGGWLIFPEPAPLPSRVIAATSLKDVVPEIYAERIPQPGELFDGTGVYDHVGGSFRLRGPDEAAVRRALDHIVARYRVVAAPVPVPHHHRDRELAS
jgi:hypothetical protein